MFLQYNRFPIYLINCVIKIVLDEKHSSKVIPPNVPKLPVIFLLPYLGSHSICL